MDWTDNGGIATAATALLAAVQLAACSIAGPRTSPLPTEGPTMEQIYRDRAGEAERNRAREALPLRPATERSPGPAREAAMHQIERRFARLPNPDLIMVVFPHLAGGKYPVPGYVTAFPMYERVEYLLPGEAPEPEGVPPSRQRTTASATGQSSLAMPQQTTE